MNWSALRTNWMFLAILLAVSAISPTASGQQRASPSLRDDPGVESALRLLAVWLDAERAYKQIPGLSVAVVHDQDVVWSHGFGLADRERGIEATAETIYSICSISKLFTSIAVMQLRDQGKLDLGAPPKDYLPWFDIQQAYPDRAPVTIHGMLTHSAGLPRESDFPYWNGPGFEFPTAEQVVERLRAQSTLYPGDTYFQYSNLGMTLLGMIVAAVSEQPFEQYVTSSILVPLGLSQTRPELPRALWGDRLATGYSALRRDGRRHKVPFFQARGIAPAAGFSSTVMDLAKFASWQFRLLDEGGDAVLSANTLREMQRVQWLDPDWDTAWGLGFSVSRSGGNTFVGHGGSCPGYRSQLRLQTGSKIATIVMANASGADTGLYTLRAFEIVEAAIKSAVEARTKAEGTQAPAEESEEPSIDTFTGSYDVDPWGGEIAVVRWKQGLAAVPLPTDNPLEAMEELRQVEGNRFRRVRDDGELGEEVVFELNDEGEVIGLRRHSNVWPKIEND